jgi:UDP-galactopyranose mutase
MFDYLIVGAGFAGSVIAERLASQLDKRVLIIDRRNHVGGNAYDHYDEAGILVHKYGPHIFHTNAERIYDYLSQFTAWRPYEHRVLAHVDGMHVPFPINIDTVNRLYGTAYTEETIAAFFAAVAEPVAQVRTSEDVVVSKIGRELYEKFFRGYTRKQWGLDPSQLDAGVAARVPARTNRDDRYFTDTYQVMPLHGYTRMFERMLAHPNITVMLQADYREIKRLVPYREAVYTGPIDEFFDYRYGTLPYRSLHFRFETRVYACSFGSLITAAG